MIHLDTSFLIHALVPASRADRQLRKWLRAAEPLAMSSIAWAEFLCGPLGSTDPGSVAGMFHEITPYLSADAELTAQLFNTSGRRRGSLADCMIAAVAIRADAALATANPTDFSRFSSASLRIVGG